MTADIIRKGRCSPLFRYGLMSAVIALVFLPAVAQSDSWGPWSASSDAPVLREEPGRDASSSTRTGAEEYSFASTPFIWIVKFHQKYISPVDGDRCPMYPTCSQYSVQAMRKHGAVLGIIMTADRLMHESDERDYTPLKKIGNRYRFVDPIDNNDFWWAK